MNRSFIIAIVSGVSFLTGAATAAPPESPPTRFPSRDDAVEAFMQSCNASPAIADEMVSRDHEGGGGTRVEFDCGAAAETCGNSCFRTHGLCQSSCAARCDDCRSTCATGDSACIRACAEARADCGGVCADGVDACAGTCTDDACTGQCIEAFEECMHVNTTRARACDHAQVDSYAECLANDPQTGETWKVSGRCARKAPKLDAFCRRVASVAGGNLDELLTRHEPRAFREATDLAARCTADAQCPADYARVAPYLAGFCAGALGDTSLESLREQVRQGLISKQSLSLVFNALGAMHGFVFKKEKWLNGFYYGSGEWLPPTCRAAIRTLKGPRDVPLAVTKLRDQVKRIWAKAR